MHGYFYQAPVIVRLLTQLCDAARLWTEHEPITGLVCCDKQF